MTTRRRWQVTIGFGMAIALLAIGALAILRQRAGEAAIDRAATDAYLASLDPILFARRGADFDSDRFAPERIGKPRDEIDVVYDYDFDRLTAVAERLRGIDRQRVLRHIFDIVARDAETDHESHLRVLSFLQRVSLHNRIQPMTADRELVCDPLILLELNEMRCGHVARLAVDLFESAGYAARGVALGRHIVAEVFYDGSWHYLDADVIGGGQTVVNPSGVIPSIAELSEHPERLDAIPSRLELRYGARPRTSGPRTLSWAYFSVPGENRFYFRKRPHTPGVGGADCSYGWSWKNTVVEPADWRVNERPPQHEPGAVQLESVTPGPTDVRVSWRAAKDRDGDVQGYRVYIASRSRGWNYSGFSGGKSARAFWSSRDGWEPEMYDALFVLPPHDISLRETSERSIDIPIAGREELFVTVTAFDTYHESVGRRHYLPSNELRIRGGAPRAGH